MACLWNMAGENMNIKTIQLTNINPAEYNPRIITKDEFEGLKTSLQTFGQQENLIVNKDMTLISGHQRLQAMLALGWTDAVCNVVNLDKHEEKKLNVLMNSPAISGSWDDLKLAEILEELKLDDDYISLRLNELEPLDLSPTEVEEDESPEVSSEPPVSKLGEIYQLGRHRVMCGDSTDRASVELLMNGVKADMVFTDPPYGIAIVGKDGKVGAENIAKNQVYADVMGDDTTDTAKAHFEVIKGISAKQIIWGGNYFVDFLPFSPGWIIWDKRGEMTSNNFADGEMAWCSFPTRVRIYKQIWNGMIREGESEKRVHPTQKPINTLADILKDHTENGDTILDGFLGSGSTLIACEQTDRTCYGMELDPKYVDVIRKRYWKFINGNEEGWEDGTTNCND